MTGRTRTVGTGTALVAASLLVGSGVASAHGGKAHGLKGAFLTGTVQNLNVAAGTLEVRGATATTSVSFGTTTRISKTAAATSADLAKGVRVSLQVTAGTHSATAVRLEASRAVGTGVKPAKPVHTKPVTGTAPKGTKPARPTTPAKPAGAGTHADGTVVSFDSATNALTLAGHHGATVVYTLAAGASLTKIVAGTSADLHNGQQVAVAAPAGKALFISILG